MDFSKIKRMLGTAILALITTSGVAQDVIARQAPSDKRLKDVHNVKLNNTAVISADLNDPASNLYTDWTDYFRGCSGYIPANYKVDLRGFCMPTTSRKINSVFGPRRRRQHEGIDIKVYIGDTIRAAFDGKVRICAFNGRGYGYYLVVRHPNGLETLYGHLSKQLVRKDQIVRAGEPIGLGGNTGRSSGSHLHFETRLLGQPINPALIFDFEHQDVTGDFYVVRHAISKGHSAMASRSVSRIEQENLQKDKASTAASAAEEDTTIPSEVEETPAAVSTTPKQQKHARARSVSHSVKSGDTLYSIARKHGTTVEKLCKLNGIKRTTSLRIGQKIKCS